MDAENLVDGKSLNTETIVVSETMDNDASNSEIIAVDASNCETIAVSETMDSCTFDNSVNMINDSKLVDSDIAEIDDHEISANMTAENKEHESDIDKTSLDDDDDVLQDDHMTSDDQETYSTTGDSSCSKEFGTRISDMCTKYEEEYQQKVSELKKNLNESIATIQSCKEKLEASNGRINDILQQLKERNLKMRESSIKLF